jgi:heme/copper-type cytochrome/quinol oxidase subunit 2
MPGDRDPRLGPVEARMLTDRVDQRGDAARPRPPARRRLRPIGRALATAAVGAALAACRGERSVLDPAGPAAATLAGLWWLLLAVSVALFVLTVALIALALRPGRGPGPSPRAWIHGFGLALPAAVLGALLVAGLVAGERLLPHPGPEVVTVHATAHRWSWKFRQPGPDGAPIETERRLYLPAGTPVDVVLRSDDVIHSFWVPRLGGKMDAIPGRRNVLRLRADAPGRYAGLCAEFCGIGHAGHDFEVVAYPPGQFPADVAATGAR